MARGTRIWCISRDWSQTEADVYRNIKKEKGRGPQGVRYGVEVCENALPNAIIFLTKWETKYQF